MNIKIENYSFTISAKFEGEILGFPFDKKDKLKHNAFKITLRNLNGINKKASFKFYGSAHDNEKGKIALDENDLGFAFYCFLSDALSGCQSFESFASEFGYDTDSRTAHKTFKACVKSADKAQKLGLESEAVLCDLINKIQEKFNC